MGYDGNISKISSFQHVSLCFLPLGINNPDILVGAAIREDDNREAKKAEGTLFSAGSIDNNPLITYNHINLINIIYITYVERPPTS